MEHAKLSASSSSRWLKCPPSVIYTQKEPQEPSEAAIEGTLAHAVAEAKLRNIDPPPHNNKEIDDYAQDYVNYIKSLSPEQLLIEQKLSLSRIIPEGFGTADAVILNKGHLHIVDLKYGQGVFVEVKDNSQLKLYAFGAIVEHNIPATHAVTMHIFQPRLNNIASYTTTAADIVHWGMNVVRPIAIMTYHNLGIRAAGTHCEFCPGNATCREYADRLGKSLFSDPDDLTPLELYEHLQELSKAIQHRTKIKNYLLQLYKQDPTLLPPYLQAKIKTKKVQKIDQESTIHTLVSEGYTIEQITYQKLKTQTDLKKILGKDITKVQRNTSFTEVFEDETP